MKFSRFVAAVLTAPLVGSAIASPIDAALVRQKRGGRFTPQQEAIFRNKYFHEPGEDYTLGHYDERFFHGIISDEERSDAQIHMIRAYLKFFHENGLDTWIAHGTLLGWWWNGKRLPWDSDMDTQVSGVTLKLLGDKFNQTRHRYKPETESTHREYLLDVNPWIWQRVRGDGMNIIDARWIDTSNGLFIDITGLAETNPVTDPGVWSCKNYHRYHTSDLYPMRETMFEGVMAKVPYAYDKILVKEYEQAALVVTVFQGHEWNPDRKLWVKTQAQIEQDRKNEEERARLKAEKEKEEKEKADKEKAEKEKAEKEKAEQEKNKQQNGGAQGGNIA